MSVRLVGDVQATIYENVAFGGASHVVSSDIPNLSQVRLGGTRGNFLRQVSSITVERSGAGPGPVGSEAFRFGQQDAQLGRPQNYRTYRAQFDRNSEAAFERDYNRGYESARNTGGGGASTEVFRSLNGGYSGRGQLTIGGQTQQVSDLLIRLRQGGAARFEVAGDGPRMILTGNWVDGNRGQIDITLVDSPASSGITGRGRLFQRNGVVSAIGA
jgi:hypothetical protein